MGKRKPQSPGSPTADQPGQQAPPKKLRTDHSAQEKRAMLLLQKGNIAAAQKIYSDLINAGTNNPISYCNLAAIYWTLGQTAETVKLLNKALLIKPDYPEALYNLGLTYQAQERYESAINSYEKALDLKPNYPEALINLGVSLKEHGNIAGAIASYEQALAVKPNSPEAYSNLGIALKLQGKIEQAISAYKKALTLRPNFTEALSNLGVAFKEIGKIEQAIASHKKALEINKDFADAHNNLSVALLLSGDYANGWNEYEWRFKVNKAERILSALPQAKCWAGESLQAADKLLLVCEQGLGDTLQFMRYVQPLKQKGIAVSLCAQPKLHGLIKASGIDPNPLTPEQANEVSDGKWVPLLSLPKHLGVNPDNPIITETYIKAPNQLIDKWHVILSSEKKPIIGINWQGNPSHEKITSHGRSLPLETFAPLAKQPKLSLLALQKGFGSEQLVSCSFIDRFVSCQDQVDQAWDFLETAAIIVNCDLVITSDTSVAHLAAGLGKPTWLLLKHIPEWRWGLTGETSCWYPTMRLFRQQEPGNWAEVMDQVVAELANLKWANPASENSSFSEILAPISLPIQHKRISNKEEMISRENTQKTVSSSADNNNPAEHNTIEQQVQALIKQGKFDKAETIARNLVATETDNSRNYLYLAQICANTGKTDELIDHLRAALQLDPNHLGAYNNLGIALKAQGDIPAAIDSYNRALRLKPRSPEIHNNLGNAFKAQNDLNSAIASYKTAIKLKYNYPEAHYNLGIVLNENGDPNAAIASYKIALELKPNYPDALYNLGTSLKVQGDIPAAIDSYNRALRLKPNSPDIHNKLGNAFKAQNDLNSAIASYKTAITLKYNYPEAHYNLGSALKEQGDLNAAISFIKTALQHEPKHPEAYYRLGVIFEEQEDLSAAIFSYKNAIQIKPNHPYAHFRLGLAQQMKGNLNEAIGSYKTTLQINPHFPEAQLNLGSALLGTGDTHAAIACFKNALILRQNYPDAHNNLGNVLLERGDINAAITSYKTALKLNPNHPDAHNNLGNAYKKQGDLNAAITSYQTALALNPKQAEAYINLGFAHQELGDLNAAITSYQTALKLNPNHPDAHYNLGNAYKEQGDLNAAITSYQTALALNPKQAEAHINLGNVLQEKGDINAAIASQNNALKLRHTDPIAHTNLSMLLLLTGDYPKGWHEYEWRFKAKYNQHILHASPKCPRWDGAYLNHHEQLLLISEQGLGDTLQFMRYAIPLKRQGIAVSLCAPTKLHGLIQASGIDPHPLTSEQANQVVDGKWIPLLSLPQHLGVNPGNPIITEPYLKTSEHLISKWREILSTEKRPIIGINWQGNPEHEKTNSRGRSLHLDTFAPLAELPSIALLSLQKGIGSEQLETCSFGDRFVSCQNLVNQTWDFLETAAIIANCDLVITSDTSVAHLAAGLGKTTWLLLKHIPEWRWGLTDDTICWYPTMRLFRQHKPGNWAEVMQQVATELQINYHKTTRETLLNVSNYDSLDSPSLP